MLFNRIIIIYSSQSQYPFFRSSNTINLSNDAWIEHYDVTKRDVIKTPKIKMVKNLLGYGVIAIIFLSRFSHYGGYLLRQFYMSGLDIFIIHYYVSYFSRLGKIKRAQQKFREKIRQTFRPIFCQQKKWNFFSYGDNFEQHLRTPFLFCGCNLWVKVKTNIKQFKNDEYNAAQGYLIYRIYF